jgi:hypothetical protein
MKNGANPLELTGGQQATTEELREWCRKRLAFYKVPVEFVLATIPRTSTGKLLNLFMIFTLSIFILGFFTYESVFQANIKHRIPVYLIRIVIAYSIAAIVVSLVLVSLNKFPLLTESTIALKRLVVITMPASMGAIIVDGLDKE